MVDDGWCELHGGIKIYGGNAAAARHYVESDHSRADDYYLTEGSGLAEHYAAVNPAFATALSTALTTTPSVGPVVGSVVGSPDVASARPVQHVGSFDGDAYESWVAGYDPATGLAKGKISDKENAVRFVEVIVNGPKTWSLAAAVHPEVAQAYDAAQERAARQIIGWVSVHGTTRVGPLGEQVQVPLERIEAATVRHYTSRAGDPHRHLHLQINAKVWAQGKWRAIHSLGIRDSLDAINGIGHAAVLCDPQFRTVLAEHGYTLDPTTGEIDQLAAYVPRFSARSAQINRNRDRFEAQWRAANPGEEPGPTMRQAWDTRAWSTARPDKVAPRDGDELRRGWISVLVDELGFTPPRRPGPTSVVGSTGAVRAGELDRDQITYAAMGRLGTRRSAWNAADVRGEVEQAIAATGLVAPTPVRDELAEDLVERVLAHCRALLPRDDVPEHIRDLTSPRVLHCEADLAERFARRAKNGGGALLGSVGRFEGLDASQSAVVAAVAGFSTLVVVEGAAGAGKTTTLAGARTQVEASGGRMVVITPTKKAAEVAGREVGAAAATVHWLTTQHGYRQDPEGRWGRLPPEHRHTSQAAWLRHGDVLVVDEAGMLTQDAAQALTTIADETGARLVLLGDRHQLPAVGRGGVLDLAARHCHPDSHLILESVHRFTDPDYAALSLQMRTGEHAGEVFDALLARGQITIHPTEVERTHTIAGLLASDHRSAHQNAHQPAHQPVQQPARPLVIAHTNHQVTEINNAVRDRRTLTGDLADRRGFITKDGQRIGVGDVVATRLNDPDLRVANRDTWTITDITRDGRVHLQARAARRGPAVSSGRREVPGDYAVEHLELAYATTAHGAQGETVNTAHMIIDDRTSAASAYVGMTRGREHNTAHLVAETTDDARSQWIDTFSRDRADLGPAHARDIAAEHVALYGTSALQRAALRPPPAYPAAIWPGMGSDPSRRPRPPEPPPSTQPPERGPSR